jgi:hypothetical protein
MRASQGSPELESKLFESAPNTDVQLVRGMTKTGRELISGGLANPPDSRGALIVPHPPYRVRIVRTTVNDMLLLGMYE